MKLLDSTSGFYISSVSKAIIFHFFKLFWHTRQSDQLIFHELVNIQLRKPRSTYKQFN